MNVIIVPLVNKHLPEIWEFVPDDYFDDNMNIETFDNFKRWFRLNVKDGLTGLKGEEVIGCAYLDAIHDSLGRINILIKRKSLAPQETISIVKKYLPHFFLIHNLKGMYAIIRKNNYASLSLVKKIGFKIGKTLKNQEKVKNILTDCVIASILRVEVIGNESIS